jgi:hypothetical protein
MVVQTAFQTGPAGNERVKLTLQRGHLKTAHCSYLREYFLNVALIFAARGLN